MLARAILIVSALLLTGCFPIIGTYFEPSTEGITARGQICHYDGGPPTRIDIEAGNSLMAVWAERSSNRPGVVTVIVRFSVASVWERDSFFTRHARNKAAEAILNIKPAEFMAYSKTSSAPIRLTLRQVYVVHHGNGQSTEPPLQPSLELRATNGDWFMLYFDLEVNGQAFSLVVPQFSVDGKMSSSRTIHFLEKWSAWIEPFNC